MTVLEIIQIAEVSQYLSDKSIARNMLYGKGIDLMLPRKIYCLTKNTQYRYDQEGIVGGNTPSEELISVSNKLYSLCGAFTFEAQAILNGSSGGGVVTPSNPSGTIPSPIEFYVSLSSLIAIGGNTLLLDGTLGNPDWKGYNMIFNRNNQPQAMISDGSSTYFTWDKVTGLFTCFGNANEDELFSLNPTI